MEDDAGGADPVADPQRVGERVQRLLAQLLVLAGAVDQVDGVDDHRFDLGGVHRLAEGGEVLLAVVGRPPHARALVEDLDRFAAALLAALDRFGEPAGGGNVRADQHDQRKPPVSDLPPRRPVRCTSAERGRHSITGSPPATAAASWCCGSRTPTASARPRRTSSRSSTRCAGWSSTGTRGRSPRPAGRPPRGGAGSGCSSPAPPTATRPPAKDVEAWKAEHGAGRGYRGTPTEEPGAAIRLRVPDDGGDRGRGPDPRPGRLPQPPATTTS